MSADSPRRDADPDAYVSGERVFGPPVGTFDVEWVAREVERRSSVPFAQAHQAVASAWSAARSTGDLGPTSLAAAARAAGASDGLSDLVARQVGAYCEAYEVDPAAR